MPANPYSVKETIAQRKNTHGDFKEEGDFSDSLLTLMERTPNWKLLQGHQRTALRMSATKVARILFGERHFDDHWKDLAGYCELVRKYLKPKHTTFAAAKLQDKLPKDKLPKDKLSQDKLPENK